MKKEMICINCPMGCYLTVDHVGTKMNAVHGNRCEVAVRYAEKEIVNPERTLTTTVKVKNGNFPLLSVKTNTPIPKNKLFDAMNFLAKIEVEAPINAGQIIVKNILETSANIVATKNVAEKIN
jgi:CxxC motif-containing protein